MDVGMYVANTLRNHLINYHETLHIEVLFSIEGFHAIHFAFTRHQVALQCVNF